MINQNFGDWSAWGKALSAPFAELNNIGSNILEKLSRENIDMGSNNLASTINHLQNSCKTKELDDFVRLQMDFVTETSSKCLHFSKEVCKVLEHGIKDYRKWGEDNAAEMLKNSGLSGDNKK